MQNRILIVCALLLAAGGSPAGEEIMPMAAGAAGPAGTKNMVKITLPSLAARTVPAELSLPDAGWTAIPEPPMLRLGQPSPEDSWRYHVPEEMRFSMEQPGNAVTYATIASTQGFDNMLDDLVVLDSAPPAPVGSGSGDGFMPLAPAGSGELYATQVRIPDLPMPSQTYRSEQAGAGGYAPPELVRTPELPPVAVPEPISISDFASSPGRGSIRPAQVHPSMRSSRPAPDTRPVPEDFAPMRNLRSAIKTRR